MVLGAPRQRARVLASAFATILMLSVGEAAQAACYGAGQQLPAQILSRFMNDPAQLLTQFPDGGPQMISLIRDLVASDPGTLPLVAELNAKANTDQVQAIGTGLGQAALVCARTAQAFSDEILRVTITANNKPMTQAFGAVMGDQFLGLAAPAGGGGAGTTGQTASTVGVVAGGASLNLATSVANVTTTTTTSSGFTPSAAVGGTSGSSAGSASAVGPGAAAVVENAVGMALGGNPGGTENPGTAVVVGNAVNTAVVGNAANAAIVGNAVNAVFGANQGGAGNSAGTVFGKTNSLESVSTQNFKTNTYSPVSPQ